MMSTNQINCPYCNQACVKQSSNYIKCAFCGKNFFSFCHEFPFEINKWTTCRKCSRQLYYFFCFKCSKPLAYDKYRMGSQSTCSCGFTGCYVICKQCNKQHCFPTGRYEGRPWKCQLCRSKFNFMTCDRCFREVYMDSFYEGQTLTCVNKKCNCRLTVKRCASCTQLFMDSCNLQYCQPCCEVRGINTSFGRSTHQPVVASWMSQAPVMSQLTQPSSLLPMLAMQSAYPVQHMQPVMETIVPPALQTIPSVGQTIPAVMQTITPPMVPQVPQMQMLPQMPQMPQIPLMPQVPQMTIPPQMPQMQPMIQAPQIPMHSPQMSPLMNQQQLSPAKNMMSQHPSNTMMPAKITPNLKSSYMTDGRISQSNLPSQAYKPMDVRQHAKNINSTISDGNPDYLCKICLDKKANYINPVCFHMSACSGCVKSLSMCPVCRQAGSFQKVFV